MLTEAWTDSSTVWLRSPSAQSGRLNDKRTGVLDGTQRPLRRREVVEESLGKNTIKTKEESDGGGVLGFRTPPLEAEVQ